MVGLLAIFGSQVTAWAKGGETQKLAGYGMLPKKGGLS
jgi:hypothetical protein